MAGKVLDIEHLVSPDTLASDISNYFQTWHSLRTDWVTEKRELRNYVFATDTRTTTNSKLPWSNSTTTPKLTQVYDNLKANYSAALFPQRKWMRFEADSADEQLEQKTNVIQAYMENKLRQSGFEVEIDKLIDDYILYGNCFATVEFASEYTELESGEVIPGYVGPRIVRISPFDIVFNPTAPDFENSPKIIRSIVTLGEIKKRIEDGEDHLSAIFDKMVLNRREVGSGTSTDKSDGFVADGFNNIEHYYGSGFVELLTFYGDIYDKNSEEYFTRRKITIVDRAYIIENESIASWLGTAPIFHAGWRSRPDNLYAMGPLDNLVGMQYRMDHLENLRADVFDQIALPMQLIQGDVEEYDYQPGEKIFAGEEGAVSFLRPDTTALNADLQIQILQERMEEMAGAPRQAMGIRTPGEKTAFEVQTLQNSASRIFQHKASKLEREFIEPVLNAMLEAARRNMDYSDTIRVLDDATGLALFQDITKEDITAKGKIVPVGARHFAERAQRVQNINQLLQIRAQDQSVGVHLSGKVIAKLLSEELGEADLYVENVGVHEAQETQRIATDAEANAMEEMMVAEELGL